MKSIQNQYIDLKEGRMSQANFMRNVRMTLPQYVTNVTSFKDAVRILKNKAILNENLGAKDEEDEEFIDMIARAKEEEEAGKYKFDDFEGGLSEAENTSLRNPNMAAKIVAQKHNAKLQAVQSDFKQFEREAIQLAGEEMLASGMDKVAIRNLLSGYGYFEDWVYDYIDTLTAELNNPEEEAPEDYEDPDMFDAYGMDASEGKINEGRKKKEPKAELHPNQIHPQELRMGIKVELEHTDDLDKAKKIALDHLAENPFYYTALKLSGIESPSAPKVKPPVEKKAKKKKEAVEMVDTANQMQKVKMPKAEDKKKLKEVEERMMFQDEPADPEKYQIKKDLKGKIVQATNDEGNTFSMNDEAIAIDNGEKIKIAGFKEEQGKVKAVFSSSTGMFFSSIDIDGLKPINRGVKPGVDLGASFDKFKSSLEEVVREVIAEYYDGRDNLDAQNEY